MRVRVFDDDDQLAAAAADRIEECAAEAVSARGRFTLALSGGSSPIATFQALASRKLPWASVHLFQVDERVAPEGHTDRNARALAEHLLERVPIPTAQVHLMPVTTPKLEPAAAAYAGALRAVCGDPPVLDLVQLGIGEDGHTASLVPGDPVLEVATREVAVSGVYHGRRRMTLTYPALDRAREIVWIVTGASKSEVVRRLVRVDRSMPAGRVSQARASLLVSREAARSIDA